LTALTDSEILATMAKDRINDSLAYLDRRAAAGQLGAVKPADLIQFRQIVNKKDRTNGGAALSLDWSWYNQRPSEEIRHAIRAYLLVSLYNRDLTTGQTAGEAVQVKNLTQASLDQRIGARLSDFMGLLDPLNIKAVLYQVGGKGGGDRRADAVCDRCLLPIEDQMETMLLQDMGVAVVLIDMQSGGDVGQNRMYAGKTVLAHQQEVLKAAANLNMIVYDIVIDAPGSSVLGHDWRKLGELSPQNQQAIIEKQRRDSYAESAGIKTISVLRALYKPGARVRHIPKPSHPSFLGTLFNKHLEADGIESVVVMGYDANQCIKATVFGVPATTRDEAEREPTGQEVEAVMRKEPKLTLAQAQAKATPTKPVTVPYVPGLLDRDITVLTSRAVLASSYAPLDEEWAMLAGLR
jgi:nicotinamidase-related amidase